MNINKILLERTLRQIKDIDKLKKENKELRNDIKYLQAQLTKIKIQNLNDELLKIFTKKH